MGLSVCMLLVIITICWDLLFLAGIGEVQSKSMTKRVSEIKVD